MCGSDIVSSSASRGKPPSIVLCVLSVLVGPAIGYCQEPIVFPGGVVSAATYTTGGLTGNGIAPGSLAVLFGLNLPTGTVFPRPLPLPTRSRGASVKRARTGAARPY